MIMEGLETLVAPSHHAYLLTESAAAAHFNVLSFDTCSLFKTAATTTTFNLNNNNHSTNSNHLSNLNHHTHNHQQSIQSQHQMHQSQTQTNNSASTSISNRISSNTTATTPSTVSVASSSVTTLTTNSGSNHLHPTLSLLSNTGSSHTISNNQHSAEDRHNPQQLSEQQTGDLNTPVTTSADVPSFFGPSTVVEPPPITGKNQLKNKNINKNK